MRMLIIPRMLTILVVCFFTVSYADDETWFAQGNALYDQKAYKPSLQAYQEIKQKGPVVWYNMGNAAYELQDYFNARLYWLHAQQHGNAAVFTASTKNLMRLAQQGLTDQLNRVYVWFWWLSRYLSIYLWQLLFLIAWYAFFFVIYKGYRSYPRPRPRRSLWASSLLILITSIPIIVSYYAEQPKALAIEDASIYNGPNSSYYLLETLPKGSIVALNKIEKKWYKISYNQLTGWVNREHLAYI